MKTKALLDKYRQTISGILKISPDSILFYSKPKQMEKETLIGDDLDPDKKDYIQDWCLGFYRAAVKIGKEEKTISTWELYQMPHCCAIMVSCRVEVKEAFRNKRIGTILNSLRQDIGRLLGYSLFFCTDIEQNVHQRKLLATNGFKDIYNVVNKRTNNRVYLSVLNL